MNPVTTENAGEKHDTARGKLYRAITIRHLVLSAKRTETQGRSMIRALYILRLTKRHVSGQSDVEQ